jgi:hypothetical protein
MDEFLFELTFASSGDFSGTLTETIPNPAPEPSSFALLVFPLWILAVVIRRPKVPMPLSANGKLPPRSC